MIGILFATIREARPFLNLGRCEPLPDPHLSLFRFYPKGIPGSCMVGVSGMGKVAAAVAALRMIREMKVDRILNPGICGALASGFGSTDRAIYTISAAIEGDREAPGSTVPYIPCTVADWTDLDAARLVTCDRPVFDEERRQYLARLGELADMEGAAIARVAQLYGTPCTLIKGITDFADEQGRAAVEQNIDTVSIGIAHVIESGLL